MKNLANCTPREFLVQTNRIRKSVANWLSLTKVMEIRKRLPPLSESWTDEEKRAAYQRQAVENLNAILDAVMDEHPEETAELLGLLCFIEPSDLDSYKMADLIGSFNELISCPEVIDFFISLAKLGNLSSSAAAKA